MTAQPPDSPGTPESTTVRRMLIGLGGIVVLGIGAVITIGVSLVGAGAIAVAWFVLRRRGRRLTRGRAWLVSVTATVIPLVVVLAVSLVTSAPSTPAQRRQMSDARARARDSMPAWLKTRTSQQQPAIDSIAEKLLDSKGFMVWISAMGALIGSCLVGLFAGSVGWLGAMVVVRGATGEWLSSEKSIAAFDAAADLH